MFQVRAQPERNRLYIVLSGHLEPSERLEAAKAVAAALARLRPGFDIVNDLSALHPTNTQGLKELCRVQEAARAKGLRTVVRIFGIPLTRLQFERMAQETGWSFETAASVEEADARLDALDAQAPEESAS